MPQGGKPYNKIIFNDQTLIDLSFDTVTPADVKSGVSFHKANGVSAIGNMPIIGADSGVIYNKSGVYTIPEGWHDGTGTVRINSMDMDKLIPANIRYGVNILGVTGEGWGGSMPIETGVFEPDSDTMDAIVTFEDTHDSPPSIIMMTDVGTAIQDTPSSNLAFSYYDADTVTGYPLPHEPTRTRGQAANRAYALMHCYGLDGNGTPITQTMCCVNRGEAGTTDAYDCAYWATNTGFKAKSTQDDAGGLYWRSDRTYAWVALWTGYVFNWVS